MKKAFYADLLLQTAAEREVIEAVVSPARVAHQEAIGQVGATIAYLVIGNEFFVTGPGKPTTALVTLFVECLIDQLFVQGLVPEDLLWTKKTGPIPDCNEFMVVSLIAEDITRALIHMDAERISQWQKRGVKLAAIGGPQEERERARKWLDVAEHVKRIIAPLFARPESLKRSGRRTF